MWHKKCGAESKSVGGSVSSSDAWINCLIQWYIPWIFGFCLIWFFIQLLADLSLYSLSDCRTLQWFDNQCIWNVQTCLWMAGAKTFHPNHHRGTQRRGEWQNIKEYIDHQCASCSFYITSTSPLNYNDLTQCRWYSLPTCRGLTTRHLNCSSPVHLKSKPDHMYLHTYIYI